MSALLLLVCLLAALAAALRWLPGLHPVQLWLASWSVGVVLYALKLLPYRELGWGTVALIGGSTVAFTLGVLGAERLFAGPAVLKMPAVSVPGLRCAALLALALLALVFLTFIAQIAHRYGLGNALRVSSPVRNALTTGSAPRSLLYVDLAIPAAAICACLATASPPRTRWPWFLGSTACIGTLYFSTGRQLILQGLIPASVVLGLTWASRITPRRLAAAVAALLATGALVFVGIGSLLGNTFATSDLSTFDNFFTEHRAVSILAVPYEHVSAPIAALDAQVRVSTTWGRAHGCATATLTCALLRHLGVRTDKEPLARPFTRRPVRWNTYTFLDLFLIDGGTALTAVLVGLSGALVGIAWALARARSLYGVVSYAVLAPALVFAERQNLLEASVLAAVVGAFILWGGSKLAARLNLFSSAHADPDRVFWAA